MSLPPCTATDFETKGIEDRPKYPPEPVSVSIKEWGRKPLFFAWGHPTKNNCTKKEAYVALKRVWNSRSPLLFHHSKFDVDVATTHFDLKIPAWERVHDTMFLLFLHDPHARELGLKQAVEKLLNKKPAARDKLAEWVYDNIPEARGQQGKLKKEWGQYIWMAPGDIVGKYANEDTTSTEGLFKFLWPKIQEAGMGEAYDRERRIMPIFLESERGGMEVDRAALRKDIPLYQNDMAKADAWICKKLKVKDLNIDSDADLATALENADLVKEWQYTKTGKKSVSKKNLTFDKFTDVNFFHVLGYRNRLATCLRMFMEPWLAKADETGGTIHPNWNQVRQLKSGDDSKGTRTGRPSCDNPNFLNVSNSFEDKGDDWVHPKALKLLHLPLVRKYCLPDKGHAWLKRDYNQQELRILAHFEDDKLLEAYKENPKMDVHSHIQEQTRIISGKLWPRSPIKTTVFGRIYGQGLNSLAEKLRMDVDDVRQIRDSQNRALPGLPALEKSIKELARNGDPICTWGGRLYYCEPPRFVEKYNKEMSFEYKLINYLVQGSAADATKEAIIRWYEAPKRDKDAQFLVTVYDEINISAPKKIAKPQMAVLREKMESIETDVPLLSDGEAGSSWGNLEKVSW